MSERLAEIEERISSFEQLRAVISAMRGIAAARSKEASMQMSSIQTYAASIGDAIGQALALVPETDPRSVADGVAGRSAVILLAAEHGFAGNFSEQVFDALADRTDEDTEIFVAGSRGLAVAQGRGLQVRWSAPMITHPAQAAALAARIAEAVFQLLAPGSMRTLSIIHASPHGDADLSMADRKLIPFDYSRFSVPSTGQVPLINIPADRLLTRLVDEYLFAEISEAIVLSLAAENRARVRAMIAAHANISQSLTDLTGTERRLRQEAITDEIIELVTQSLEPF